MSDEKRGFFRRAPKKTEESSQQDNVSVEAVVENPTVALSVGAMENTEFFLKDSSQQESLEQNVTTATSITSSPKEQSTDGISVFTPRGMGKESPVEEKIHDLKDAEIAVKIDGWNNDMKLAPTDGSRIMVSEDGKGEGFLVYWRISKYVDRKNLRYVPRGRWTDFLTKIDIPFMPKYWKPYDAEQLWPLRGKPA